MDMHVPLCLSICVAFLINLIVFSEASVLYCNNQKLTWRDAMTSCINSGGTPVGKNIHESSKIQKQNQTYWTSDFITKTVLTSDAAINVSGHLCGYKLFHWPNGYSKEKFANCSFEFKYICCREVATTTIRISTVGFWPGNRDGETSLYECIQTGTWEMAFHSCHHKFLEPDFRSDSFDGRYWTRTAIELTLHETPGMHNWLYTVPNIYQCGTMNGGGGFDYTDNCNKTLPSYCSFESYEENISHMRVCSFPVSLIGNTSTKTKSSYMTSPSTSPTIPSSRTSKKTTPQSTATKNVFEASNIVIGVAVGVGVPVVLASVVLGLIFLLWRGIICKQHTKDVEAHADAAYCVTNGAVSFSAPALSTNENSHQHRDNECRRTDNVYSRVNKQNPKIKEQDPKAPYGKEKQRVHTARDTKRQAKETTTQEYDITCFKDSTKLVQKKEYHQPHEGTDEYNTTRLGNIQLPHDSDYNTLGESGVYNVTNLCGNKVPNAISTIANNGTYNTLSNQEDDYNTVNLHGDKAHLTALRSDDTYNTLRDNTNDYNVVDFNGETNAGVMIHPDDTYNTDGRGTDEYNTVDFHRTNKANKSEDCYDHLH